MASRDRQFAEPRDDIDAVALAERQQDVVDGGFLAPNFGVVALRNRRRREDRPRLRDGLWQARQTGRYDLKAVRLAVLQEDLGRRVSTIDDVARRDQAEVARRRRALAEHVPAPFRVLVG